MQKIPLPTKIILKYQYFNYSFRVDILGRNTKTKVSNCLSLSKPIEDAKCTYNNLKNINRSLKIPKMINTKFTGNE